MATSIVRADDYSTINGALSYVLNNLGGEGVILLTGGEHGYTAPGGLNLSNYNITIVGEIESEIGSTVTVPDDEIGIYSDQGRLCLANFMLQGVGVTQSTKTGVKWEDAKFSKMRNFRVDNFYDGIDVDIPVCGGYQFVHVTECGGMGVKMSHGTQGGTSSPMGPFYTRHCRGGGYHFKNMHYFWNAPLACDKNGRDLEGNIVSTVTAYTFENCSTFSVLLGSEWNTGRTVQFLGSSHWGIKAMYSANDAEACGSNVANQFNNSPNMDVDKGTLSRARIINPLNTGPTWDYNATNGEIREFHVDAGNGYHRTEGRVPV